MINIVVCEDNLRLSMELRNKINNHLKKNNISFKISSHIKYNEVLKSTILNKDKKVYLLDIELEGKNGLDIANEIRDSGDWDSVIIIMTTHTEMLGETIKRRIQILDYVNKYDDFFNRLVENVIKAIEILGENKPYKIETSKKIDFVNPDEIIYVEKEVATNKSTIHLKNYNIITIEKNLNELKELFGDFFKYSHRACLINVKNLREIDFSKGLITFINGESINLLSRKYKKELRDYVV